MIKMEPEEYEKLMGKVEQARAWALVNIVAVIVLWVIFLKSYPKGEYKPADFVCDYVFWMPLAVLIAIRAKMTDFKKEPEKMIGDILFYYLVFPALAPLIAFYPWLFSKQNILHAIIFFVMALLILYLYTKFLMNLMSSGNKTAIFLFWLFPSVLLSTVNPLLSILYPLAMFPVWLCVDTYIMLKKAEQAIY